MNIDFYRTFHPVGHGAFYTEDFHPTYSGTSFRVVYDCGSNTLSRHDLENLINGHYSSNPDIDLLFISHFDKDHINGVKYLNPKRVVIPFLTQEELNLYLEFDETYEYARNYKDLVDHCENNKIQIIYVFREDHQLERMIDRPHDIQDNLTIDMEGDYNNRNTQRIYLRSGSNVSICMGSKILWKYQVHNPNINKYYDKFWELVKRLGNSQISIPIAPYNGYIGQNYAQNHLKDLKTIYSELGNKNLHSLVVYSNKGNGISQIKIVEIVKYKSSDEDKESPIDQECNDSLLLLPKLGCFYFGDAQLLRRWLEPIYDNLKLERLEILMVQVPHHGSKNNNGHYIFGKKNNLPLRYCIISAKDKDPKHPSPILLNRPEFSGKCVRVVTEDPRSGFKICATLTF
ncbi:MAG: hypothetical protein K2M31_07370 [Muribaculaceae bacterium]|nr:hypothetical protein [Muribaculaceae bacterium]